MDAHGIALKSSVARRQFGRCLLLGLPLAGAALAARPQVVQAGSANDSWKMEGNSNVDSNDFLGTTTNISLVIKTDNVERMRVTKDGLIGIGTASPSTRLHAISPYGTAIRGDSTTTADAAGVLGRLTAASPFASAAGVKGEVTTVGTSNGYGVYGKHAGNGAAICAEAPEGTGLQARGLYYGVSAQGFNFGVAGEAGTADDSVGVVGATSGENGSGVIGVCRSTKGIGVRGRANNGNAQGTYGVYGDSVAPTGIGVYGEADSFSGATFGGSFKTRSPEGTSVYGLTTADSAGAVAIYGDAPGSSAYAGYFAGKVQITGLLSKAGGSFTIDHPLDPERKYLSHSFVESPEMLNVYNGNATTDASGQATVELPAYFEALNRDFRYQLTVVGQFAQAIVAAKIAANRFTIATDKPNVEVSWQVTGIRKDAWAEAHRVVVEEEKPAGEQGSYLHPAEHGQPEARGKEYARDQRRRQREALPPAIAR